MGTEWPRQHQRWDCRARAQIAQINKVQRLGVRAEAGPDGWRLTSRMTSGIELKLTGIGKAIDQPRAKHQFANGMLASSTRPPGAVPRARERACGDQAELRSGTRAVEAFRNRGAYGIRHSRHVVAAFPDQVARSARGHAVGMPPKAASARRGAGSLLGACNRACGRGRQRALVRVVLFAGAGIWPRLCCLARAGRWCRGCGGGVLCGVRWRAGAGRWRRGRGGTR